jgi:hypothetical protein
VRSKTPPTVNFDMKGRLICPLCKAVWSLSPQRQADSWITRGIGRCPAGHDVMVTDKVANALNEILAKNEVDGERKQILKNFEESPDFSQSHDHFKKNMGE